MAVPWDEHGIFTWNPNGAPYFAWKMPYFGTFKNRCQLGSRYLLFYPIKIHHLLIGKYTIHGSYGKQTVLFTSGINVGKYTYTIIRPMDGSGPMAFQEGNRYFTTCLDLSLAFQKHQPF